MDKIYGPSPDIYRRDAQALSGLQTMRKQAGMLLVLWPGLALESAARRIIVMLVLLGFGVAVMFVMQIYLVAQLTIEAIALAGNIAQGAP